MFNSRFPRGLAHSNLSMKKTVTILNLPVETYYYKNDLITVFNEIQLDYSMNELDTSISLETLNKLIASSDLLIIPGLNVFRYYGESLLPNAIAYYNSGGNIIYYVDPNVTAIQNDFLKYFEMGYEGIRLRTGGSYNVPFAHTTHSFRDNYLYKAIDQIIVTQPNHITYWGNTRPLLVSNGNFLSIDGKSDTNSTFPGEHITPIAIRENKNEGKFLAINGFIKIKDDSFDIDDNKRNLKFLGNLYTMIFDKKSRYVPGEQHH